MFVFGCLVLCFVWRLFIIWGSTATFLVIPPWIVSRLVAQIYEAFAYLFGWNISTRLLSATEIFLHIFKNLESTVYLGIIEILPTRSIGNHKVIQFALRTLISGLVKVDRRSPWISVIPSLPVTPDPKRSAKDILFAWRRRVETFWPIRCANA